MDHKATEIYKEIAKLPKLLSGDIVKDKLGNFVFESFWEQCDLPRSTKLIFRQLHIRNQSILLHQDTNEINELWRVKSPSGIKVAILKKSVESEANKLKQRIEIWSKCKFETSIDLDYHDKHSIIYTEDEIFASLNWSCDENQLIYVAEKKIAKSASFFTQETLNQDKLNIDTIKGNEYEYSESWGEQMSDKNEPVICLIDLKMLQIRILDIVPTDISPAQAKFINNDEEVIFVGYVNQPKRLGLIYCTNRESHLCKINLKTNQFAKITENGLNVRSPVPSPNGNLIVFLENDALGPHHPCSKLMLYDICSGKISTVVDIVQDYKKDEFSGIYLGKLNDNCWSSNSTDIYFSTNCGSRMQLFSVNVISKKIQNLSDVSWPGNFEFLNLRDNVLMASISSPNQPSLLVFGLVGTDGLVNKWTHVQEEQKNFIEEIAYKVVQHSDCEYILITPVTTVNKPRLLLVNHGGPHSAFTTNFETKLSALCLLKFAILLVNYRGSIGFGNTNLTSLAGNIGSQEILETQSIVEEVVKSRDVDSQQVYVTGGSHGGFITLHLIAKFPEYYKAAVVRNPVFNIAAMLEVSDIPDWAYYECGLTYNFSYLPTASTYEIMLAKSPITYLNQIKTPTMLMLGGKDKRVPPSQGLACHHHLKAIKCETKVLWYKDSTHALSEVLVDADQFVHIVNWFQQFR